MAADAPGYATADATADAAGDQLLALSQAVVPVEELPVAAPDDLASRAARGALVTLAGQGTRMVLQIGSVVVLARLLVPRDYGLIAMVLVIVGVGEIFRDFGLTNAVVRAPTLSRRQQDSLFWLSTGIGMTLTLLVFAGAPLVAAAFGQPELTNMTRALAWTFAINGLATQYRAHLTRELRFGRLAAADVSGQAIGLGVAILAAVAGAGRWALVAQQLVQLGTVLILVAVFSGWFPRLPRRGTPVASFVRLGSNLAATQVLYYITNNLDTLTIAVRFSSSALGLYTRGFQLLMTPLTQLRAPATTVAVPILARLSTDYARAGEYLKRGQLALGYSIVPMLAVVVGAPGPIVAVLLGPHWTAVAPILAFLALAGGCSSLAYVGFWVYVSRGMGKQLMRYTGVAFCLQLTCILVGSSWGVVGVAAGYAAAALLEWPLALTWLSRLTPIPARELLLGAARILGCAVFAGSATRAATYLLRSSGNVASVAVALATTAAAYGFLAFISARVREDMSGVLNFAHRMMRR